MLTFLLRRLVAVPVLLFVISVLTFSLLHAAPGDFYANLEQDPQYTYDYVMELRASSGRVVEVAPADRAAIGTVVRDGRTYAFSADGLLLRDGSPAPPKDAQAVLRRFEHPEGSGDVWTVTEAGRVYRWVGAVRGYFQWIGNVARLDFGKSWSHNGDVTTVMFERLGNTLTLSLTALVLAWSLAIPLGVWSGVRPNSLVDHACGAVAYMSLSVPAVFLSLLALLFALSTGWFPVGDMRSLDAESLTPWAWLTDRAWHLVLPAAVVGLTSVALYMRQTRSQMIEMMSSDYVRTARAKGVAERRVVFVHALRNAINPLVTLFGFSLAHLLSGSFLVEVVFNWPGLALVTVNAVFSKDEPLVMASVLFATLLLVAGNLVADVLLAVVDPRIRLE